MLSSFGRDPQVAVDATGIGHVVWDEPKSSGDVLHYCELAPGATSCANVQTFVPPQGQTDSNGPKILLGPTPGQVLLLTHRCCAGYALPNGTSGTDATFIYASSDGGHTFRAPTLTGTTGIAGDPVFGPGGFSVSTVTDVENSGRYQAMSVNGFTDQSAEVGLNPAHPTIAAGAVVSTSLGLVDPFTPIFVGYDFKQSYFRVFKASDGFNDLGNWGPLTAIGPTDDPRLASGPSGVFLMSRDTTMSGSQYVVRRYDGSAFGPPTPVSEVGDVIFRDFFEDGDGTLHAVWLSPHRGLEYRVSLDGGVTWSPPSLVDANPANDIFHLDVGACGPGDGFAVWDDNDSAGTGGMVQAIALGPVAHCGAPPQPGCPSELSVGVATAVAQVGCFTQTATGYTTSSAVRINGLELDPGTGSIQVDPASATLTSVGSVLVKAGGLSLDDRPLSWRIPAKPGQLSDGNGNPLEFDVGRLHQQLLDLPVNGLITPSFDGTSATLPVNLQLPGPVGDAFGDAVTTNDITLHVGPAGLDVTKGAVHIGLSDVDVGLVKIDSFALDYSGDPFILSGVASFTLPVIDTHLGGGFTYQQGQFADGFVDLTLPPPGIPLVPPIVYLNGGGIHFHKLSQCHAGGVGGAQITGSVKLSAFDAFDLDGGITVTTPESDCGQPFDLRVDGTASALGVLKLGNAFFDYTAPAKFQLGGDEQLGIADVVSGSIGFQGGVDLSSKQWYLEGHARLDIVGVKAGSADVIVGSAGVWGCVNGPGRSHLGGFYWTAAAGWHPTVFNCHGDATDFRPAVFGSASQAKATATAVRGRSAAIPATILPANLPFVVFKATGTDGPPGITLIGPRGERITVPHDANMITTSAYSAEGIASERNTYVRITSPSAGQWSVTALTGSTITALETADGRPPPVIHAKVVRGASRHGPTYRLVYTIQPQPGMSVQFFEQTGQVLHAIGRRTSGRGGTVTFTPIDGPGGVRQIVADLLDGGQMRGRATVAAYRAPAPPLLTRPGNVRITRRGTGINVAWQPVAGASGYAIRVALLDGRELGFTVPAGRRSITVSSVPGFDTGAVMVASLRADNEPGPIAHASLQARPTTTSRCRVPNLSGKGLNAALVLLGRAHCSLGTVTRQRSPLHLLVVVSQRPNPGRSLQAKGNVSLTLGPPRHKH